MSTVAERPSMAARLESSIDRKSAGDLQISAQTGMVVKDMGQVMEFAKLMSLSRQAVPPHLRENPGACLAISIQAYEWQISPFALAGKSYVVNDRMCYEASLYHAIVERRAPIKGRIKHEFSGEGANRVCRVFATLAEDGSTVDYESPRFSQINPKNSPLWKNDPDQQLFYFSVRGFARRNFPDVMMGIYTNDEMLDAAEFTRTIDTRSKADRIADKFLTPSTVPAKVSTAAEEHFFAPHDTDDRRSTKHPTPEVAPQVTPQAYMDLIADCKSDADIKTIIDELNAMQTTGPLLFDECVQLIEMANSRRNSLK